MLWLALNIKPKLVQSLGMMPFAMVKKFSRIKIERQVFHSKAYSRVSKRNSFTVVYKEKADQFESYGQIQFFLLHQPPCSHRPLHPCQLCEGTPFAVIWKLEPCRAICSVCWQWIWNHFKSHSSCKETSVRAFFNVELNVIKLLLVLHVKILMHLCFLCRNILAKLDMLML